ncbi:FliA/WhiG family RNA polymerase sigma factor [Salipaludibacillus neizhouensis]|uniref:FliA/WhiG family RNA polymerase sigma factor n=1 Tax=Salipaludibacillus neizhouensis TaxID=885475 RepID=A0A3A9K9Z2_9BACI|nr:FliA/WhiG family RNA polymerase sigma factor [Salipaludibacillus neizhouensis]RKL69019.1 FliA/WhiG family RNA polymerase sigma factor [Salipaludibacillus neizhouensis]
MSKVKESVTLTKVWDRWVKDRDPLAGDRLIEVYLPLVDYHVQRISVNLPRSIQLDDLRSHGLVGLYDALEKFDHTRELKFDTYASFRIRGSIIDGLRKEDWLPRSIRDKSKKVEQTIEQLEQQHGRYVTSEEVASELGWSANDVTNTMNESFFSHLLSIDEPTSDTERDDTYSSSIVDQQTPTPEESLGTKARNQELAKYIKTLNENEQLVISLFYFEEFTLTEIGEVLNLSTSRISQIHSKTLFKLQQKLKKDNL